MFYKFEYLLVFVIQVQLSFSERATKELIDLSIGAKPELELPGIEMVSTSNGLLVALYSITEN